MVGKRTAKKNQMRHHIWLFCEITLLFARLYNVGRRIDEIDALT